MPLSKIAEIARSHAVGAVVVGLPLDLSGQESEWCAEVREAGAGLADRIGVPLHLMDERMTSVRAERVIRSMGLKKSDREDKGRVDAAAATLILQLWLDGSRT